MRFLTRDVLGESRGVTDGRIVLVAEDVLQKNGKSTRGALDANGVSGSCVEVGQVGEQRHTLSYQQSCGAALLALPSRHCRYNGDFLTELLLQLHIVTDLPIKIEGLSSASFNLTKHRRGERNGGKLSNHLEGEKSSTAAAAASMQGTDGVNQSY